MLDAETLRLLGKRAKLDSASLEELPLMINEKWGSDVLNKAYKDRLTGANTDNIKDNIKDKDKGNG
jgi:hypothetical protein